MKLLIFYIMSSHPQLIEDPINFNNTCLLTSSKKSHWSTFAFPISTTFSPFDFPCNQSFPSLKTESGSLEKWSRLVEKVRRRASKAWGGAGSEIEWVWAKEEGRPERREMRNWECNQRSGGKRGEVLRSGEMREREDRGEMGSKSEAALAGRDLNEYKQLAMISTSMRIQDG